MARKREAEEKDRELARELSKAEPSQPPHCCQDQQRPGTAEITEAQLPSALDVHPLSQRKRARSDHGGGHAKLTREGEWVWSVDEPEDHAEVRTRPLTQEERDLEYARRLQLQEEKALYRTKKQRKDEERKSELLAAKLQMKSKNITSEDQPPSASTRPSPLASVHASSSNQQPKPSAMAKHTQAIFSGS